MENVEQEAIRRVLAGEVDAYRLLMERHLPTVLRMTRRVTGSDQDAEEAAQEAFLRAYNKLRTFREHAAFGTWVYRIAMNCSLNLIERRRRDPGWNGIDFDTKTQAQTLAVLASPTPETDLLEAEAANQREQLLTCLTPMERTAFVLRHLEEQPVAVIAEALGITGNTARQTIFRAVGKLRKQLAPTRPTSEKQPSTTRFARGAQ